MVNAEGGVTHPPHLCPDHSLRPSPFITLPTKAPSLCLCTARDSRQAETGRQCTSPNSPNTLIGMHPPNTCISLITRPVRSRSRPTSTPPHPNCFVIHPPPVPLPPFLPPPHTNSYPRESLKVNDGRPVRQSQSVSQDALVGMTFRVAQELGGGGGRRGGRVGTGSELE